MNTKTRTLAAAAASLFLAGVGLTAGAVDASAADKIKCEGVNQCKGSSDCKTLTNECSGHNACKGKGFVMLTPEECAKAKAEAAKEKMEEEN
jgi:hypothetical protein